MSPVLPPHGVVAAAPARGRTSGGSTSVYFVYASRRTCRRYRRAAKYSTRGRLYKHLARTTGHGWFSGRPRGALGSILDLPIYAAAADDGARPSVIAFGHLFPPVPLQEVLRAVAFAAPCPPTSPACRIWAASSRRAAAGDGGRRMEGPWISRRPGVGAAAGPARACRNCRTPGARSLLRPLPAPRHSVCRLGDEQLPRPAFCTPPVPTPARTTSVAWAAVRADFAPACAFNWRGGFFLPAPPTARFAPSAAMPTHLHTHSARRRPRA